MRLSSPEDLGRYLRECRREAGLSQCAAAARAGLSRRWLADLEAGKPTVEVGLVIKLIAALGLMLDVRPEPKPEMIRWARASDVEAMRAIEVAAGRAFAAIGMVAIAEDEPLPAAELLHYQRDGRAWVATGGGQRPVAYVIVLPVDGLVHIEQVSVHPDAAGRGIGASLIEHVARWASEQGAPALTLTTFVEVPWNAPYYERLGFRRLADTELTPGLVAIRRAEAEHGLDRWPRVAMRRDL